MKSQSDSLLKVAGGIIRDIRLAYPDEQGLDLDFKRLALLVRSRGLGVFTLDLPARDQALLEGLESGRLNSFGTLVYRKNYRVPRLFSGLYMRIFDQDLCLKENADVNAILFLRQLLSIGKKIEVPCSKKRELQTIEEYIHVEQELTRPTFSWDDDNLDLDGNTNSVSLCDPVVTHLPLFPELNAPDRGRVKLLLQRCQRVADLVAEELGTFCPDCFIEARREEGRRLGLRHGPGAVAERRGRYFNKYLFPSWPQKLQGIFPYEMYGRMPNDERSKPSHHESYAYLHSVPKTAKGPRLIAAEPTAHQWCQQLMLDWLTERIDSTFLRRFINFRDQECSGKMALHASLDRSLATVDLSSASDRLSLHVVERVFRRNPTLLKGLHAARTRWLYIPHKGEYIKLKKFASQGTAVTFPIQTLVFFVLAMGCSYRGTLDRINLARYANRVRVFGDDIILPSTGYADLVSVLHYLQLKVNTVKSFNNGYFRESCGVDGYKGYDITPCKPKTLTTSGGPASCLAVLDISNNLFYKGYWNASEQLKRRLDIDPRSRFPIVGRGAGATGYQSYSLHTAMSREYQEAVVSKPPILCNQDGFTRHHHIPFPDSSGGGHKDRFRMDPLLEHICRANKWLRYRYSTRHCRYEVRVRTIRSVSKVRPYDCGYSGLLEGQVRPAPVNQAIARSASGVPERPSLRNVRRWVGTLDFLSGIRGL